MFLFCSNDMTLSNTNVKITENFLHNIHTHTLHSSYSKMHELYKNRIN